MNVDISVPDNNADLAKLDIHLPSVPSEEVSSPAEIEPYLKDYLKREGFPPDNGKLDFIKIVKIENIVYWIWRFDSDGDSCYATATQKSDGSTGVGCDMNDWSLTPDQYIFGDFHECF